MGWARRHRSVTYICIAAVLLAAVMPGVSVVDLAIPEPGWILLPDLAVLTPVSRLAADEIQPQAPCAPRDGRAPPASLSLA